ncbi:MAG: nuclear transport factor 2 family protein [Vicinamibacterales bacterium]
MSTRFGRRTFLGTGALLAATPFTRTAGAAGLTAADRVNVAAVTTMAGTWKSLDVAKRNSVFTTDAIFRGAAERVESPGQKGHFKPGPIAQFPVIEMVTVDMYALDPLVITSHHQLFPANVPPMDDWYLGVFYLQNGLIREWLDWAVWEPKPATGVPPNFGAFHQPRVNRSRMAPQDVLNVATVEAMCATWQTGDADTILKYLAPDCRVRLAGQRVETPATVGLAKAKESFAQAGYFGRRKVTIETVDVLALDPLVVTSQRHVIEENGVRREAWYVGQFFLQFGHIREWVNYEYIAPRPIQTPAKGFGTFTRVPV